MSVCDQPNWISTGGTGLVAAVVRVMAGTSSSASTTPSTRPASADGTLSMSFSRQSCPAAARGATPSAASSAVSARRCRTPAAMLTQKPVIASTAAAMATASSPCCGTVDSGSASSPDAIPLLLVTAEPGGSRPARPGGTPERPAVASHHWVTGAGSSEPRPSTVCRSPRLTMSPPPLPVTVGKLLTAAMIFTLMVAPSMLVSTVEPTLVLLAARKRCVARPGMTAGAAGVSASCPDMSLGAVPGNPLAARP